MSLEKYETQSLPQINETNVKEHCNKQVLVCGKVSSIRNNTLYLQTIKDSKNDIGVKNFKGTKTIGSFVRIVGKVYNDGSLEFVDHYDLGDNFDLEIEAKIVECLRNNVIKSDFY